MLRCGGVVQGEEVAAVRLTIESAEGGWLVVWYVAEMPFRRQRVVTTARQLLIAVAEVLDLGAEHDAVSEVVAMLEGEGA